MHVKWIVILNTKSRGTMSIWGSKAQESEIIIAGDIIDSRECPEGMSQNSTKDKGFNWKD